MDRNIQSRVKRQMERAQKEYYLNEKIKAIQKELGRGEKSEFDELKKKIETAGMPKDVFDKAMQELKKLEAMPPMSAESTVSRNYSTGCSPCRGRRSPKRSAPSSTRKRF